MSMDEQKKPGIGIDSIHLMGCNARMLDHSAKLQYNMGLTHLERTEDKNSLGVVASFDMMAGIEKPACLLKCTFAALYSRDDSSAMTWAEFSDAMAVSHMIPYVREFVSSVTLRMPMRPLVLQPTNVYLLLDEYKASQVKVAPAGSAEPTKQQ